MYFRNYRLGKTWLDKCLNSPFSADALTDKVVNGPKHCFNLNDSIFIICIHHCERNLVRKSLS